MIYIVILNNEPNFFVFLFVQGTVAGNPSFRPCDGAEVSETFQKYELRASDCSFLHCLVACFKSYNYFTTTNVSLQCSVIWTKSMWRLFFLVKRCYELKEPVLLVGETGGGKTTVCQLLSSDLGLKLHILNCHQYTETSDFLGVGYHHLWCLISICVLECHLKIFWKCLIFMN